MNYLINQNNEFNLSYTREGVQDLIDQNKIGLNTPIWTEQWGDWKQIKDTDFNLEKAIYVHIEENQNNVEINEKAKKDMLFGALWCVGGIIVTAATYSAASGGGRYVVAWGAIIFGAIQFFRGLAKS